MLKYLREHFKRTFSNERGTWGGIAMGVGALGSAAIGTFGGSNSGGSTGYDVVTMPQYSFTEPRMRLTSDFLSDNISRMSEGKYPAWWDKALPQMRENMSRPNYQTYWGRPGERTGNVQGAMEAGAITGIGPRAANAQAGKQMKDYADKETAIDEYLTQLGANNMWQASYNYPQLSAGMPKGPDAQIVGGMGQPAQQSPWLQAGASLLGNADLMSSIGSGIGSGVSGIQNWLNTKNFNSYGASAMPEGYQYTDYGVNPGAGTPAWYSNYLQPGTTKPLAGNGVYTNTP